MNTLESRAAEIAQFLGIPEAHAIERLAKGFLYQHAGVNADFRLCNPVTDEELLSWYRTTEEYIWELSAYHLDPGFNYAGKCAGIAERLKAEHKYIVLCLGDGIGDLTIALKAAGFDAFYHDLAGSKTAEFAAFRFKTVNAKRPTGALCIHQDLEETFEPKEIMNRTSHGCRYDAVVSLDFLEHVDGVPKYVQAIYDALLPGGIFCAQNAFDCGSGPDGAIPCHLAINDKYAHPVSETDRRALWDVLLDQIGFVQLGSNWHQRSA